MSNPWDAQIEIDVNVAQKVIEQQFPQLIPVHCTFLGKGFDNTVFKVYEQYVFRFPRRNIAISLLEKEKYNLPLLAQHLSVPVSKPLFSGKPSDLFSTLFLGSQFLCGTSADYLGLTDNQRIVLACAIAQFLKELHAIHSDTLILSNDPFDRFNFAIRYPTALENITKIETLQLFDNCNTIKHLLSTLRHLQVEPYVSVPVHGDLYSRHLLLNDQYQLAGIIDWGDIHLGHPAVDLAILFTFLPQKAWPLFFETYGSVDQNTLNLALFRAIYHTLYVILYSHDVGDKRLFTESQKALYLISKIV